MSTLLATRPAWAEWTASAPYTLGIEEEVMLLDPAGALANQCEDVLAALPAPLHARTAGETHGAALELSTEPHAAPAAAERELRGLRRALVGVLDGLGLRAASGGTHPEAEWHHVEVSPGARYQQILASMRALARREPTFALHVHVGVPDPEVAVGLHDRLRGHLPMLLALSANSPFWQGRDTGLASARTHLFGGFPRTGIPRGFRTYEDWVRAVEVLVASGAIPEPTFLWWDVRLQPALGTVEVRIMDAQVEVGESAALAALVQAVARLEIEEGYVSEALLSASEALEENRFLAARDGLEAQFVDPDAGRRVTARRELGRLLAACAPHAADLGTADELEVVRALAERPAHERQRAAAAAGGGPRAATDALAAAYLD
jgi:carboxylate-amine ligase